MSEELIDGRRYYVRVLEERHWIIAERFNGGWCIKRQGGVSYYPHGDVEIGELVLNREELALQSTEIAQLRRDNATLRTERFKLLQVVGPNRNGELGLVLTLPSGSWAAFFVEAASVRGSILEELRAVLLAPPTTEAPDVQQGARNALLNHLVIQKPFEPIQVASNRMVSIRTDEEPTNAI